MKKNIINESKDQDQTSVKPESTSGGEKRSFLQSMKIPLTATILLLITANILWPKVSIVPGEIIDPREPFNTNFLVLNKSVFSLYDIRSECIFDNIKDTNGNVFRELTATIDTGYIERLRPDDVVPMIFHLEFKDTQRTVSSANIHFFVQYKLPFINKRLSKTIPMTVTRTQENTYQWSASEK